MSGDRGRRQAAGASARGDSPAAVRQLSHDFQRRTGGRRALQPPSRTGPASWRLEIGLLALAVAAVAASGALGQVTADDFAAGSFTDSRGMTLQYRLFEPPGYDAARTTRYPLVTFLHGNGDQGSDNRRQVRPATSPRKSSRRFGVIEGLWKRSAIDVAQQKSVSGCVTTGAGVLSVAGGGGARRAARSALAAHPPRARPRP